MQNASALGTGAVVGKPRATSVASDANFCRVPGTPEALMIDFGLNENRSPEPNEPVEIAQRIIVHVITARRLPAPFHIAVHRHEAAFGMLETDVPKRVVTRPQA